MFSASVQWVFCRSSSTCRCISTVSVGRKVISASYSSAIFRATWGIFFGEFQCLLVNDSSAVSCDSGALTRGSEPPVLISLGFYDFAVVLKKLDLLVLFEGCLRNT